MLLRIIDKTTRQYIRDDFNFNPDTEEGIATAIPSGFVNTPGADRPVYDPVNGKWTGTLLADWELDLDSIPRLKAAVVTQRLVDEVTKKINSEFNRRIAVVKSGYMQEEIDSWAKQEKEAREYIADPVNAVTPLISGIAAGRGETMANFSALVIQKADVYAGIVGPLIGRKRVLLDSLAGKTDAQLQSYNAATEWDTP